MSKKSLATGTSPFAHLLSGFRAKLAAEEEKDAPDGAAGEEDDDPEAEEPEEKPEEKGKKSRRGENDEEQDPEADDGDDDTDAEEEDLDDDARSAFRRGLAMGRKRENARCARIFGHEGSGTRPDLAATLAFTTRNSSAEAGRLLAAVGAAKPRPAGLSDRMANRRDPRPGADMNPGTKPSFGERVAAATKKATGR